MASNSRHQKFNFRHEIGEDILCFEPDPSKARVLYDAKILDTSVEKLEDGAKVPHYFVHFKGWKNKWDRLVPEDEVLEPTEEHVLLKRRLAEVSKRVRTNKTRKKRIQEILDKALNGELEDESLSRVEDDDDSGTADSGDEDRKSLSSEDQIGEPDFTFDVTLPPSVKAVLEEDCMNIMQNGKLHELPSSPNVLSILEDYLRRYAGSLLCCAKGRRRRYVQHPPQLDMQDINRRVEVCKEIVDGVRVCFDELLPRVLLYASEQEQLAAAVSRAARPRPSLLSSGTPRLRLRASVRENDDLSLSRGKRPALNPPKGRGGTRSGRGRQRKGTPAAPLLPGPATTEAQKEHDEMLRGVMEWRLGGGAPDLTAPSHLYGGVHLARLFVKLPGILTTMKFTSEPAKTIQSHVQGINAFLADRAEDCLASQYIDAS